MRRESQPWPVEKQCQPQSPHVSLSFQIRLVSIPSPDLHTPYCKSEVKVRTLGRLSTLGKPQVLSLRPSHIISLTIRKEEEKKGHQADLSVQPIVAKPLPLKGEKATKLENFLNRKSKGEEAQPVTK